MNMQFWNVAVCECEYGIPERGCGFFIFVINGEAQNFVTWAARGLSLTLLKSGGLREGHAVTTWGFVNMSECAWKQRKAEKPCVEMACSRAFWELGL